MNAPFTPDLISLVVPAFNEEENLPVLVERLRDVMEPLGPYEILIIDDGSTDQTKAVLRQLSQVHDELRFISFSRNFGHQMALRAGYEHARGACAISLDADLQHPPELIPTLVQKWREDFEVVYTVRKPDPTLSWRKRFTSRNFYKLLRAASDLELEDGAADFRLLDRKVIDTLKSFKENDLFLRGMISWVGFRQCRIEYEPAARFAGTTKYSFKKMFQLAVMGITSFTTKPLYASVVLGLLMALFSTLFGLEVLYEYFFTDGIVSGYTTVVLLTLLIGGAQFIVIGIIGVYLGKTFVEVKQRPPYIIGDTSEIEEVITWQAPAPRAYSSPLT
ncbi:glycosyltransferase family 2 protein [Fibrella sp. HMF5335]|uniref:Glycosyltransferase family 2 protein n=1 Tax=Fibrella rubiginis TaxID=2817060 RepID=A0A939GF72_9BACT|nr:glycosyltransferase family 2 protein [Fibrella rubiginis]MBO0936119.1 glycosyltransferase family 2 protein [Fibrella rubiginis]